jgi:S1-C subfamily serine protease
VAQPYIGLVMQPVEITGSLQTKAGVEATAGLLVMHVEPGGPADVAGALLGDILIDMDGHSFEDLEDVHVELRRKAAGQDVVTRVIRGGQRIQFSIRVGERPVG